MNIKWTLAVDHRKGRDTRSRREGNVKRSHDMTYLLIFPRFTAASIDFSPTDYGGEQQLESTVPECQDFGDVFRRKEDLEK